jgi:NAD-dependent SIR2 family protein deacetylase
MAYALGKYSQAICDRCGFQYPYLDLRQEWNNFKVCPECYESKARQLEPTQTGSDPEALFQPRPDVKEDNNRFIVYTNVGLGIIGEELTTFEATGSVGTVTVAIS